MNKEKTKMIIVDPLTGAVRPKTEEDVDAITKYKVDGSSNGKE